MSYKTAIFIFEKEEAMESVSTLPSDPIANRSTSPRPYNLARPGNLFHFYWLFLSQYTNGMEKHGTIL